MDLWTFVEVLNAICNISVYTFLSFATPEMMMNSSTNDYIDLFVLTSVVTTWLRLLSLMLVLPKISLHMITVYRIIESMKYLICVLMSYLLFAALI